MGEGSDINNYPAILFKMVTIANETPYFAHKSNMNMTALMADMHVESLDRNQIESKHKGLRSTFRPVL